MSTILLTADLAEAKTLGIPCASFYSQSIKELSPDTEDLEKTEISYVQVDTNDTDYLKKAGQIIREGESVYEKPKTPNLNKLLEAMERGDLLYKQPLDTDKHPILTVNENDEIIIRMPYDSTAHEPVIISTHPMVSDSDAESESATGSLYTSSIESLYTSSIGSLCASSPCASSRESLVDYDRPCLPTPFACEEISYEKPRAPSPSLSSISRELQRFSEILESKLQRRKEKIEMEIANRKVVIMDMEEGPKGIKDPVTQDHSATGLYKQLPGESLLGESKFQGMKQKPNRQRKPDYGRD